MQTLLVRLVLLAQALLVHLVLQVLLVKVWLVETAWAEPVAVIVPTELVVLLMLMLSVPQEPLVLQVAVIVIIHSVILLIRSLHLLLHPLRGRAVHLLLRAVVYMARLVARLVLVVRVQLVRMVLQVVQGLQDLVVLVWLNVLALVVVITTELAMVRARMLRVATLMAVSVEHLDTQLLLQVVLDRVVVRIDMSRAVIRSPKWIASRRVLPTTVCVA